MENHERKRIAASILFGVSAISVSIMIIALGFLPNLSDGYRARIVLYSSLVFMACFIGLVILGVITFKVEDLGTLLKRQKAMTALHAISTHCRACHATYRVE